MQKLKGLSETVTNSFGEIAKGNSVFVESATQEARMSTCRSCEDFNSKTTQCKKCGCFMSAKHDSKLGLVLLVNGVKYHEQKQNV